MALKWRSATRQGFSLISVMVTLAITGIVVAGLTEFFINFSRDQKRLNVLFQIQQVQRNLSTFIASDDVWKSMVLNNASLDCLKPAAPPFVPPPCNHGLTNSVTLFTPAAASYFDPALQGFTLDGEICLKNDPKCKMTLNVAVELKCPGTPPAATCAIPDQIIVRGSFQPFELSFGNPFIFNANNFQINVVKENVLAAAAGGGGTVIQTKCPWARKLLMPLGSCLGPNPCINVAPSCLPPACPPGFTDGGVSTEVTTGTSDAVGTLVAGNVTRTCYK